jgi:hypothetical protein
LRLSGADPIEPHRQIAHFRVSSVGVPPPVMWEGTEGVLVGYNGGEARGGTQNSAR